MKWYWHLLGIWGGLATLSSLVVVGVAAYRELDDTSWFGSLLIGSLVFGDYLHDLAKDREARRLRGGR